MLPGTAVVVSMHLCFGGSIREFTDSLETDTLGKLGGSVLLFGMIDSPTIFGSLLSELTLELPRPVEMT